MPSFSRKMHAQPRRVFVVFLHYPVRCPLSIHPMAVRTLLTPFRSCSVPYTTISTQQLDFRSARHSVAVGLFSALQFLFPAFAARELVSSSGVQSFQSMRAPQLPARTAPVS